MHPEDFRQLGRSNEAFRRYFDKNRQTFIFDIDGTLADVEHRRHFVTGEKKDFERFNKECVYDPVKPNVANIARILEGAGHIVICVSGRNIIMKKETEAWLKTFDIRYTELFMRAEKDFRHDTEVKEEFLKIIEEKYSPICAIFDDRKRVVDMWRAKGYTCLQVAEGNF